MEAPKKVIKHGNVRWRVLSTAGNGKCSAKFFETEAMANQYALSRGSDAVPRFMDLPESVRCRLMGVFDRVGGISNMEAAADKWLAVRPKTDKLLGDAWPLLPVSAETGEGLERVREAAFRTLKVIRVYAKPPGKPASTKEPIILPLGSTVRDMASSAQEEIEEARVEAFLREKIDG